MHAITTSKERFYDRLRNSPKSLLRAPTLVNLCFKRKLSIAVTLMLSLAIVNSPLDAQERERPSKVETKAKPGSKKQETRFKEGMEKREDSSVPGVGETEVDMEMLKAMADVGGTGVYDVGIIPGTTQCPPRSALVEIFMDDEDHNNNNSHWGWLGAIEQDHNTRFRFCRVDGLKFKPLVQRECNCPSTDINYAVLKFGSHCPPGSNEFEAYFDNEDSNNSNSSSGNIWPNVSNRNTRLYFCLFRSGTDTMDDLPDFSIEYGVFAASDFSRALDKGLIYIDCEDDQPETRFTAPSWLHTDASTMVYGLENMTLRLARVK